MKTNICSRSEELPSEESLFLSNRRSKKRRALNTRAPREAFDAAAGGRSDENLKEDADGSHQRAGSSRRGFSDLFDSLFCCPCCPGNAAFVSRNNAVGLKSPCILLRIHLCCFNHENRLTLLRFSLWKGSLMRSVILFIKPAEKRK